MAAAFLELEFSSCQEQLLLALGFQGVDLLIDHDCPAMCFLTFS